MGTFSQTHVYYNTNLANQNAHVISVTPLKFDDLAHYRGYKTTKQEAFCLAEFALGC